MQIKEKEIIYKRLREKNKSAKMVLVALISSRLQFFIFDNGQFVKMLRFFIRKCVQIAEEKAAKQMREMVPHARPLPKFNNSFLPQK